MPLQCIRYECAEIRNLNVKFPAIFNLLEQYVMVKWLTFPPPSKILTCMFLLWCAGLTCGTRWWCYISVSLLSRQEYGGVSKLSPRSAVTPRSGGHQWSLPPQPNCTDLWFQCFQTAVSIQKCKSLVPLLIVVTLYCPYSLTLQFSTPVFSPSPFSKFN